VAAAAGRVFAVTGGSGGGDNPLAQVAAAPTGTLEPSTQTPTPALVVFPPMVATATPTLAPIPTTAVPALVPTVNLPPAPTPTPEPTRPVPTPTHTPTTPPMLVPVPPTSRSIAAEPLRFVEGQVLFEDDFESGFARNREFLDRAFSVIQEESGN